LFDEGTILALKNAEGFARDIGEGILEVKAKITGNEDVVTIAVGSLTT
jgi:hypothetical protein